MKKVGIYTLGCRVNQYESEAVAAELRKVGIDVVFSDDVCDYYVVNTCAVTNESERKSRQVIRHCSSLNPNCKIIVMGCYSQIKKENVLKLPNVKLVIGNRNKLDSVKFIIENENSQKENVLNLDNVSYEKMKICHTENARAFIKIEDGCNNHCTYCKIKDARGNVVSREMDDVVDEVRGLSNMGYKEVVLTGIEVASYGYDLNDKNLLCKLIDKVSNVDGIERIRFGSIEPSILTKEFVDYLSRNEKIMPSFHISLQSGSSSVLMRMKRKYNRNQVLEKLKYLKDTIKNCTLTCDIIVGFPGETEEEFKDTIDFAKEIEFLHMHVFPYSKRDGTEAAIMKDQLEKSEKENRARKLISIGNDISKNIYDMYSNYDGNALFETFKDNINHGHTDNMLEVVLKSEKDLRGKIVHVKGKCVENNVLVCEEI